MAKPKKVTYINILIEYHIHKKGKIVDSDTKFLNELSLELNLSQIRLNTKPRKLQINSPLYIFHNNSLHYQLPFSISIDYRFSKIAIRQHDRSHQRPQINGQTNPAAGDFHPHARNVAVQFQDIRFVWLIPVRQ